MSAFQADREDVRIVLYSHDSVGLGHIRRNLSIAHALADTLPVLLGRTTTGLLITGEGTATGYELPEGWDWLVIPGISKKERTHVPRRLDVSMRQLTAMRSSLVESAVSAFRPDLMIVDRHAFGVRGELKAALQTLRMTNPGCRVVLGLREVLDHPVAAQAEWHALGGAALIGAHFDRIWVYGDPQVHNALDTGEIPAELAGMTEFTGYLSTGRHISQNGGAGRGRYVMTMVGGGFDGYELARAAARAKVPRDYKHLIVTGPQMPAGQRRKVKQAARKRTSVVSSVPDALAEVTEASAVVTMGGYNSLCEVMSTRVPALVVPRAWPRQEQLIRATSLAERSLVELCRAENVSSEALGKWFARAAGTKAKRNDVDLCGLAAVGRLAAELLEGGTAAELSAPEAREYGNVSG